MIQISALIDPDYLVEIEVTALRSDNDSAIDRSRMQMWSNKTSPNK